MNKVPTFENLCFSKFIFNKYSEDQFFKLLAWFLALLEQFEVDSEKKLILRPIHFEVLHVLLKSTNNIKKLQIFHKNYWLYVKIGTLHHTFMRKTPFFLIQDVFCFSSFSQNFVLKNRITFLEVWTRSFNVSSHYVAWSYLGSFRILIFFMKICWRTNFILEILDFFCYFFQVYLWLW